MVVYLNVNIGFQASAIQLPHHKKAGYETQTSKMRLRLFY